MKHPEQPLVNPPEILLVGGFSEVIELCEDCSVGIRGILDLQPVSEIRGIPILGDDDSAANLDADLKRLPVIICQDDPALRRRLTYLYRDLGYTPATVIHPRAMVSHSAHLDTGVILNPGANVSADVTLEDGVVLNTLANVMHDSRIGAFTTIAPNAVVLGRVVVGSGVYVGSNSTILPERVVGDRAVIGAGAVVTRDVAADTIVVGNPARVLPQ